MNALKEAKRHIASDPYADSAQVLTDLVIALESAQAFQLERLYALDLRTFELATDILAEWRLDRYYAQKAKLLDLSVEARSLNAAGTGAGPA